MITIHPRFNTDGAATKKLFEHIVSGGCNKEVIVKLLGEGADISLTDMYMHDNSLLTWQIANAYIDQVDNFLTIVSDYHFKDIPEIFEIFINKKDRKGKTALFLASLKGWHHKANINSDDPEMQVAIKSLVNHGADINLSDKFGNTPLHMSVLRRDTDAVKYFLSHGANVYNKNSLGLSPIQMLRYNYSQACKQIYDYTLPITIQSEEAFDKSHKNIEDLFNMFELRNQHVNNIFDLPGNDEPDIDKNETDNIKVELDIDGFIDSMHNLFVNNKYSATNVDDVLKLMSKNNIVMPNHQLDPLYKLITVVNKENATAKIFGYSNIYWDCFCQFVKGLFGKDRETMIKSKCDKFKNTICEKNNFIPSYNSLKTATASGSLNSEAATTNIPKCSFSNLY